MRYKSILILLNILASLTATSQYYEVVPRIVKIDIAIQEKVDSLKIKGTENIIIYHNSTDRLRGYIDSNGVSDIRYLIWLNGSYTFIQKFVNPEYSALNIFEPIKIPEQEIHDYIKTYTDSFFIDEILPFVYKVVVNDIKSYHPILETLHGSASTLTFYSNNKSFTKHIDHHHFKKIIYDGYPNLNYTHNRNSRLKKLLDLIYKTLGEEAPY